MSSRFRVSTPYEDASPDLPLRLRPSEYSGIYQHQSEPRTYEKARPSLIDRFQGSGDRQVILEFDRDALIGKGLEN
jgi:hypothetical protein